MSGQFIVIEGLEGAGKSTAVAVVKRQLEDSGVPFIQVREPGGTPLAEALRELIKQPWEENVAAEAELLVMYAARIQLVRNVIIPPSLRVPGLLAIATTSLLRLTRAEAGNLVLIC